MVIIVVVPIIVSAIDGDACGDMLESLAVRCRLRELYGSFIVAK